MSILLAFPGNMGYTENATSLKWTESWSNTPETRAQCGF